MGWTKGDGTCSACTLPKTIYLKIGVCPACYRKKLVAEGKFDPKKANDDRKKRLQEQGCLRCKSKTNKMTTAKLCSSCYYDDTGRQDRERLNANYRAMYARRPKEIAAREREKYRRRKEALRLLAEAVEAERVAEARRQAEGAAKRAAEEKARRERAEREQERERLIRERREEHEQIIGLAIQKEARRVAVEDREEAGRRSHKVQEGMCLFRSCTNPASDEGEPPANALCPHHTFRWMEACNAQNPYRSPRFRPEVVGPDRDQKSRTMDFTLLEGLIRDAWKGDRPGLPQF